jgi:type I restriction enzyme M protein
MPDSSSQTFLRGFDKKLWTAADKLRSNLDSAVYKYAVLGLIFLKYVSDSIAHRQAEIVMMQKDTESDLFVDPEEFPEAGQYEQAIRQELEVRDYYVEKNVFWVPPLAYWKTIQSSVKLPHGSELNSGEGKAVYRITSIGRLIDDALEAVVKENLKLKNLLNKNYTQFHINPSNLPRPIDPIATIALQHADIHTKDTPSHGLDFSHSISSSYLFCVFRTYAVNKSSSYNFA